MTYYKYRKYSERTINILTNSELFFSLPEKLNDPLDVSVDIQAEYERAKAHVFRSDTHPQKRQSFLITLLDSIKKGIDDNGKDIYLNNALYQFMQSRGVLSLSKTSHDALLWSHYADGHRGICLGFNSKILEIEGTCSGDVIYTTKPPYFDKFIELTYEFEKFCRPWDGVHFTEDQGRDFYNKQVDAMLEIGLYTKSKDWQYEKEFRLTAEPGNHLFPRAALQEIIIGAKTPKAHEDRIRTIIEKDEYSHVILKKSFNTLGTFEFDSYVI